MKRIIEIKEAARLLELVDIDSKKFNLSQNKVGIR